MLADLISSELRVPWLVAVTANWVVRFEATRFVVAATNHSAFRSDEIGSDEKNDTNAPLHCVPRKTVPRKYATVLFVEYPSRK